LGGVFWAAGVAWGPANSLALVDAGGGDRNGWGYEDRALLGERCRIVAPILPFEFEGRGGGVICSKAAC